MIVKMIQELGRTMKKMQEVLHFKCCTKDLEELKNKWTQMNNIQEGINRRITEAEEWINNLEDRMWKLLL